MTKSQNLASVFATHRWTVVFSISCRRIRVFEPPTISKLPQIVTQIAPSGTSAPSSMAALTPSTSLFRTASCSSSLTLESSCWRWSMELRKNKDVQVAYPSTFHVLGFQRSLKNLKPVSSVWAHNETAVFLTPWHLLDCSNQTPHL